MRPVSVKRQTAVRWDAEELGEAERIAEQLRRKTGKNVTRSDVLRRAARHGLAVLRAEAAEPQSQKEESKS